MYDLTPSERANKTALLLVNERYSKQLAPFVKSSKTRLTYVSDQVEKLVGDVCQETGADYDRILLAFNTHLADILDAVLKNPGNAKREELSQPNLDEPFALNNGPTSTDGLEGIVDADVLDRGEVVDAGRAEALEPDARVDLDAETAAPGAPTEVEHKTTCFRCGGDIADHLSKRASVVCVTCTADLRNLAVKTAYPSDDTSTGWGAAAPAPGVQEAPVANPNMPYTCTICGQEGSADEVRSHINRDHADVLQRQDGNSTENMGQDNLGIPESISHKQADMFDEYACPRCGGTVTPENDTQDVHAECAKCGAVYDAYEWPELEKKADVPRAEDAAEVGPLPENPGDRFDDYVQRLAETAAARKFSMPTDEDIHSIASQSGASPDDVKNQLICTAVFGDNVAVNGQLGGDPTPPEGYEEIAAQGLSGQLPTHDAVVPTDLVITTVANEMNMSADLAYNMVKDKYGADLPDKYHASISGQVHYYLPTEIAGNQQQQVDPQTGPAAPPAPQVQPQRPLAPTQ